MPINDSPVQETGRPVAGPVRTAAQLVPSAIIVEIVDSTFWDMTDRQYAAIAAGLLLVFSWAQNFVESRRSQGVFI